MSISVITLERSLLADHDLYPEDEHGYRRAIIEAFSAWGILPDTLSVITEKPLVWPELRNAAADLGHTEAIEAIEDDFGVLISRPDAIFEELKDRNNQWDNAGDVVIGNLEQIKNCIGERLDRHLEVSARSPASRRHRSLTKVQVLQRDLLGSELSHDRETAYLTRRFDAAVLGDFHSSRRRAGSARDNWNQSRKVPATIETSDVNGLPKVSVRLVRMARRIGRRGQTESEYVVEIIQSRDGYFDPDMQALADAGDENAFAKGWKARYGKRKRRRDSRYRAGATLLIDASTYEIRRVIRTRYRADEDVGLEMRRYLLGSGDIAPNAFDGPREDAQKTANTFAALHRHVRQETIR